MNKYKVSVILPIYNCEKYIERCINSILNQTYQNMQILLIDDGSTDNSGMICDNYSKSDSRIVVVHKKNEGVSKARNMGLELAEGEYITFVDADDWIENNMIEKMVSILEEKKVDIVRCNFFRNYRDGSEKVNDIDYSEEIYDIILNKDAIKNKIITKSLEAKLRTYMYLLVFKKKLINEKLRFESEICLMEDLIFELQLLLKADSMYMISSPLYHYFQNYEGITKSNKQLELKIESIFKVDDMITNILRKKNLYTNILGKKYTTNNLRMIDTYLLKISQIERLGDSIKIYNEYLKDKRIIKMINMIDLNEIPIHKRISINLIKHKSAVFLAMYYKTKNFIGLKLMGKKEKSERKR